jgi:Xaa-Pro aminopeptidase
VLVLVRPNELKEKWDGKRLRREEATAISGIQTIVWLDSLDALLQPWIHLADKIYLDTNENDRKASLVRTRDYRFVDEMRCRYPLHHYERAARIMKELRSIKTPQEIEVVKQAVKITGNTFQRLLKFTRTVPVNGKFSDRQKEVYNACLHLHNYAKSILKPGISIIDYTEKVGDEATQQFIKIGLLKESDVANEDKENRAFRKYLYHGISHHLGIDVHDLGTRTEPVKAGMLFTVEPGIYIEEEGIGIRIENNVWLTESGNVDLFEGIPITVEEIEAAMKP